MTTLEDRFFEFCRTIAGAELIDELTGRDRDLLPAKRGDVLFENRSIVSEVKSLETDTLPKVEPILAPYRDTEDWPVFYGEWQIGRVIQHLPDSQTIANRIGKAITSAIPGLVKKAHRQIRATKDALSLTGSEGLLIVLNETLDVLSPKLLGDQVNAEINKKLEGGRGSRYPHINMALVLDEAHVLEVGSIPAVPSLICTNWNAPPSQRLSDFVDELQLKWATFNGGPALQAHVTTLLAAATYSRSEADRVTLSELWRRNYRKAPYLRGLSDEELFAWAAPFSDPKAVDESGRTVRPFELPSVERFTHFLEEIAFRGIDLRRWGPELRRLASDRKDNSSAAAAADSIGRPLPSKPQVRFRAFYRNSKLGASYYCENVGSESAAYIVLESQPRGLQARFTQSLVFAWQYEEVTDATERKRLQTLLDEYLKKG
jgi:hypothetical protein